MRAPTPACTFQVSHSSLRTLHLFLFPIHRRGLCGSDGPFSGHPIELFFDPVQEQRLLSRPDLGDSPLPLVVLVVVLLSAPRNFSPEGPQEVADGLPLQRWPWRAAVTDVSQLMVDRKRRAGVVPRDGEPRNEPDRLKEELDLMRPVTANRAPESGIAVMCAIRHGIERGKDRVRPALRLHLCDAELNLRPRGSRRGHGAPRGWLDAGAHVTHRPSLCGQCLGLLRLLDVLVDQLTLTCKRANFFPGSPLRRNQSECRTHFDFFSRLLIPAAALSFGRNQISPELGPLRLERGADERGVPH